MLSLPCRDRLLPLAEVAAMLGLSARTLLRLRVTRGLPLRRASRKATPGALESELLAGFSSSRGLGGDRGLPAAPPRSRPGGYSG